MTTTSRNFVSEIPTHAQNASTSRDEDALLRAAKELGEYYPIAKQKFGSTVKIAAEVTRQIALHEGKTRAEDGAIITGILNLEKFGLTKEQAEHQAQFLKAERESGQYAGPEREAMLYAVKELGPDHLHEAIDRLGSLDEVAKRARVQLDNIPEENRKKGGLLVIGFIDLEDLGLSKEQAHERYQQILEMKQNPQRYLTVVVNPEFRDLQVVKNEAVLREVLPNYNHKHFEKINGKKYPEMLDELVDSLRGGKVNSQQLFDFGFNETEAKIVSHAKPIGQVGGGGVVDGKVNRDMGFGIV